MGQHKVSINVDAEAKALLNGRFRGYISYLQESFRACGFVPEVDILRIPSTKRVGYLTSIHPRSFA